MTSVGGVVVAVALLAVAMAAVFGADDVRFLKGRAGGGCRVSAGVTSRDGEGCYIGRMKAEKQH